jgi:hypothetical protein
MVIGPMPGCPPSGNVMRRKYRSPHAYKRLREGWQRTIWAFLAPGRRCYELPEQKMHVVVTIEHMKLYDADNAISGCKPLLDSLTNLGIIRDDSPERIELHVLQVKSRENQTTISVEAI